MRGAPYVDGFDPDAVLHVLRNLRPEDRIEAFDRVAFEDAWTLTAAYVFQRGGFVRFFTIRPTPLARAVAFLGVSVISPGMGSAHMLATPKLTPRMALYAARRIRAELPVVMAESGLHRVECACLESHASARSFLRHAGATIETRLPRYGKRGLPYLQHRWTLEGERPCA